jgi:hypothetical protein
MSNIQLLRETASVAVLANTAISAVIEGEIDPITAHINISKMENAIKAFKANDQVRDITLRELSKYGKKQTFGDCTLEEVEAGVKYDYSACGDSELEELYKMRQVLDESIKQREAFLKNIPIAGIVIAETGELVYPPAKSSKTTIKTTFKKQ